VAMLQLVIAGVASCMWLCQPVQHCVAALSLSVLLCFCRVAILQLTLADVAERLRRMFPI
jgi:hypothetical protein